MQFNSYIFIIIFLPVMLLLYFLGNKAGSLWGKIVLILGSLVFYSCAGMDSLMMLGISFFTFQQIAYLVAGFLTIFSRLTARCGGIRRLPRGMFTVRWRRSSILLN